MSFFGPIFRPQRSAVAWLLAEVLKVIKATFGEIKMLMDDDVELEV